MKRFTDSRYCGHGDFTRIILNAHDWLARRADQRGLYYEKSENCLVDFTDEQALRKLADTFANESQPNREVLTAKGRE